MSRVDELVKEINKEWKQDIAAKGIHRIKNKKIPFTSPRLNYMLYGGIPRGYLIEFCGDENGGKTTSALDLCANAQRVFQEEWEEELSNTKDEKQKKILEERGPLKVLYADCENTLDEDWARTIGVDVDIMYIIRPMTQAAEDIFQIVLDMLDTGEIGLVIIDSIGVMMSKQAYEKDMTEKTYGGIAMPLTLFSKKAELLCHRYTASVVGINQMRDDMNNPYGGKTTTGGRAWKHNCVIRLQFAKGDYLDENGNAINRSAESPRGNRVMVSVLKQKADKPDRRTGYYTLMYDYGIDEVADLIEVAIKYGIVNKAGAWFSLCDIETGELLTDENGKELKFQGQSKLREYLESDDILLSDLRDKVMDLM